MGRIPMETAISASTGASDQVSNAVILGCLIARSWHGGTLLPHVCNGEVMDRFRNVSRKLADKLWPEKVWFEDNVTLEGVYYPRLSKFLHSEFSVPLDFLMACWGKWSQREKATFASAFAMRPKLVPGDSAVIDFLMESGSPESWSMIALLVAREYPDRDRAFDFLMARVSEPVSRLAHSAMLSKANYYQALGVLGRPECVPELKRALARHREFVRLHPSLHWWKVWTDRLVYLDYLSCSATLFRLTGEEQYRTNLRSMLEHRDMPIRQMVRAVT